MSRPFPYTYIACPCAETRIAESSSKRLSRDLSSKKTSSAGQSENAGVDEERREEEVDEDDEEEQTFDPRSPRANFSLYPPEQLLYCEDCHQIKCPRCITEEIVCWYCPNCLFETPSSMVRSEGNRCARNCFNCPICTAPLAVTTLENTSENGTQQGPWILACGYCMWTTLDIGIKFHKPTNIRAQLAKFYEESGPDLKSPLSTGFTSAKLDSPVWEEEKSQETSSPTPEEEGEQVSLDPHSRFAALKRFYQKQIEETSVSATDPLGTDFGAAFSSPSALNRIMSLYTSSTLGGLYGGGAKKAKSKPPVMREALTAAEGLKIASPDSERATIEKMASEDCGWDGVLSMEQRQFQSPDARFVEDLRPLPVLLRTKRSKRCKACKHILVKPEFKPASTRFRIRLIALSYIPLPTLRPLVPTPYPGQYPGISTTTTTIPQQPPPPPNLDALPPNKPIQYLLTLKNHMFDPVRVTLATPSVTPGRVASKVTILCPQFDLGANSDVWDEALQAPPTNTTSTTAGTDRYSSRPGAAGAAGAAAAAGIGFEKVAEAGKVWDKGRNWTTVVLEVVPGPLPGSSSSSSSSSDEHSDNDDDDDDNDNDDNDSDSDTQDQDHDTSPLREDEDVLEIPVFVRLEWDSENQMMDQDHPSSGRGAGGGGGGSGGGGQKPELVKRELAYWMVLGVGRIAPE
ncbi:hypothetical protein VTN77DRAFT_7535 [Rasamsonia byssochlamydoides]|uniref:uncharacterized protein n=1 Tax=Rasamsonia byssochlamydoides TaxID=89139 RepID=UPI00374400AE